MKRLTLISVLLSTSLVYAAAETTQTLLPKGGQQEFKAGLTFLAGKATGTTSSSDGIDSKNSGYTIPLSYYYGLADGNALGLETSYENQKTDTDSTVGGVTSSLSDKSMGLGDLTLRYKGLFDLGAPSLYVSAGYRFGLDKSKTEDKSATESESNAYSSQPQLILEAGVVQPLSGMNVGALANYSIGMSGKEETKSVSGTTTESTVTAGGSVRFEVFGELENYFHPNLALDYVRNYSKKSESGATTTTSSGYDLIAATVSGRMEMAPGVEFIPSFVYETLNNKTIGSIDFSKYDIYAVNATVRFLF